MLATAKDVSGLVKIIKILDNGDGFIRAICISTSGNVIAVPLSDLKLQNPNQYFSDVKVDIV